MLSQRKQHMIPVNLALPCIGEGGSGGDAYIHAAGGSQGDPPASVFIEEPCRKGPGPGIHSQEQLQGVGNFYFNAIAPLHRSSGPNMEFCVEPGRFKEGIGEPGTDHQLLSPGSRPGVAPDRRVVYMSPQNQPFSDRELKTNGKTGFRMEDGFFSNTTYAKVYARTCMEAWMKHEAIGNPGRALSHAGDSHGGEDKAGPSPFQGELSG